MKIIDIEEQGYSYYIITLKPNWLERLFGLKQKTIKLKDTGSRYTFGNGRVYMDEDGNQTGNGSYFGETIDNWRRKKSF